MRSVASVAGPAISDSRPEAARRISSIWNMPIARVHKPERGGGIGGVGGVDARDAVGVEADIDRPGQPGDARLLRPRRQGEPQHARDDGRHKAAR